MYTDADTQAALALLRGRHDLIADARTGAPVNNSLAGALLTQPLGPIGARQYAEAAVRRALELIDGGAQ